VVQRGTSASIAAVSNTCEGACGRMILVVIVLQRWGDRTMTTKIIQGKKGSSQRRKFGLVNGVHCKLTTESELLASTQSLGGGVAAARNSHGMACKGGETGRLDALIQRPPLRFRLLFVTSLHAVHPRRRFCIGK
jgi:hypothetical protein